MSTFKPDEAAFSDIDGRYAVIATRWNDDVVGKLTEGAVAALARNGIADTDIDVMHVPGAFELPLACKAAAATGDYAAVIALGAVIRGGTPHFEYVSGEAAAGLTRASMDTGVPVAFGVLTVDNLQQALDRAGGSEGNKGEEAALSMLEMVELLRKLDKR